MFTSRCQHQHQRIAWQTAPTERGRGFGSSRRCGRPVQAALPSLATAGTSVGAAPKPPRSIDDAVRQARTALRVYREAMAVEAAAAPSGSEGAAMDDRLRSSAGTSTSNSQEGAPGGPNGNSKAGSGSSGAPRRLIVELPLPSQQTGFLGRGTGEDPNVIRLWDEGDWPGGELQKFRAIKKLVDGMLDGYGAEFLGFLEDSADGVGLWALPGMTVVANVTNATVPSLVKLFDGGYGSKVQQPGHTVVAVNPQWTDAQSVGQPWQWGLRARAAEVLDEQAWEMLYTCKVLRGSRGANGLLHRAWPHRWALYPAATPDARYLGECLLAAPRKPDSALILQLLNEAKPQMQALAKEVGVEDRSGRLW